MFKSKGQSRLLRFTAHLSGLFLVVNLCGCSTPSSITNIEPVQDGKSYQAQYQGGQNSATSSSTFVAQMMNGKKCEAQADLHEFVPSIRESETLSAGDIVDVVVARDETFTGRYEISQDGMLKIKNIASVLALNKTVSEVGTALSSTLTSQKFFNSTPLVSVRLSDYGSARVFVSGAVFEPGAEILGGSAATAADNSRVQTLGATTEGRRLSRAIQSAGGVRPDADLSRVSLIRDGIRRQFDLRSAISGHSFEDVIVLEGDQISVPSRGCFQSELMVPSVISPTGIRVFMSNLTEPALHNSNAGINKDVFQLRYGTRFMQAVFSMNCVGGSKLTNASRSAVLYTHNPITGKSIAIERSVENLVRNANRDDFDPYILPNDSIACYDSGVTDVVKVAQSIGIVGASYFVARGL